MCSTCCKQGGGTREHGTVTKQLSLNCFPAGFLISVRLLLTYSQVCQPLMPDGSNCDNATNVGKYITDFKCQGVGSSARMLKEMRLSFPSGHSSFTFYTMVYVAVSVAPLFTIFAFCLFEFSLAALLAIPHELAGLEAAAPLTTVPIYHDRLVHGTEPRLGLQASLVGCAGGLSHWSSLCADRGKFNCAASNIVQIQYLIVVSYLPHFTIHHLIIFF